MHQRNNLKITTNQPSDPYAHLIHGALIQSFPTSFQKSKKDVVDAVSTEILATNQIRFGPLPSIENQAAIRAVVRKHVETDTPIPVLVPWGSKKPVNSSSVDVAEIFALKTLNCLHKRISEHYSHGVDMRIRVEDLSGFFLFKDEGNIGLDASEKYVRDFVSLTSLFNFPFVEVFLETQHSSLDTFVTEVHKTLPSMIEYIRKSDEIGIDAAQQLPCWSVLKSHGWHGEIPIEQRDYYRSRYAKIYQSSIEDQTAKLAEYLSSSLARYRLELTGARKEWGRNFIQINFANPVPGFPDSLGSTRSNYRTVPMKYTRDHIPPWRAKGYYKIHEDNTISPALTSFQNESVLSSIHELSLKIASKEKTVEISSDYAIVAQKGSIIQMNNKFVSPNCCESARTFIQLRFAEYYVTDPNHFRKSKPFWTMAGMRRNDGECIWDTTALRIYVCPFCGKKLPDVRLKQPPPDAVIDPIEVQSATYTTTKVMSMLDGGYRCNTCGERLHSCTCDPPETLWEIIPESSPDLVRGFPADRIFMFSGKNIH